MTRSYDFPDRRGWNELKVKVLSYLVDSGAEAFTAKEVAEALDEPLPRIQMELLRLTRQGCLTRFRGYRGGRSHPFEYDLKDNAYKKLEYLKSNDN